MESELAPPCVGGKRCDRSCSNLNTESERQTRSARQCFQHSRWYLLQAALVAMILSSIATTFTGLPARAEEIHTTTIEAPQFTAFLEQFAQSWSGLSLSTSFNGIDSPGHASHSISTFLSHHLGKPVGWTNVWGIEKDNKARAELLASAYLSLRK